MVVAEGYLGQIYAEIAAAGLDPGRWQNVINLLSENTGVRAHLWGFDQGSALGEFFVSHGIDDCFLDSFARHYAPLNPWPTSLDIAPVGRPMSTDAMCAFDELRRTEFHGDWLLPQGDISAGGGVVLVREPGRYLAMGGMVERRRQDRVEAGWLELLLRITPALTQALATNRALSHMALRVVAAVEAPVVEMAAALVVRRDRRIVLANAPAEALLRKSRVITSGPMYRLCLTGNRAHSRLEAALGRLAAGLTAGGIAVDLSDVPNGQGFECHVAPFPPIEIPFAPLGPKTHADRDLAVVIVKSKAAEGMMRERLRSAFRLSGAETDIVLALAEGLTIGEIADRRAVSIHTVRNQMKSVLSKTDSRRQSDLVRLVEVLRRSR